MQSKPLIFKVHFPTVRSGSYLPIKSGSNSSFSPRQTTPRGEEIRVRVSRLVLHLLLLFQILFSFSFFYFTTNRISDLSISVSHQIKERSKQIKEERDKKRDHGRGFHEQNSLLCHKRSSSQRAREQVHPNALFFVSCF